MIKMAKTIKIKMMILTIKIQIRNVKEEYLNSMRVKVKRLLKNLRI